MIDVAVTNRPLESTNAHNVENKSFHVALLLVNSIVAIAKSQIHKSASECHNYGSHNMRDEINRTNCASDMKIGKAAVKHETVWDAVNAKKKKRMWLIPL